ncbi:hypothetical protein E8E13_009172 [Curvularia kusanoi]|uniref:Uncharacterized protein n=1 Tax=Curvularia kusanoi TaxID=90978 RepID=A0A9P4WB22_CURKU|nr:hypothetical protein E8E13_009172 [Curvularia kusanoi]
MSSRRPLQPIPALPAKVSSTRYAHSRNSTTKAADGTLDMEEHVLDDVQDSGSAVSGLTSLEGDDEFERLMIQNARDERRLNEARNGRVQPFRKARTHPRVGLTMDNLERNDAQHQHQHQHGSGGSISRGPAIKSPPSSSASTRSDPAVRVPASWGRKGRTSTSWMRNITRDEQPHHDHTPAPPDETPAVRRSVEDSPLSHKSFQLGTPRRDSTGELDLTFEMNEASMLASTPYMPRNTKLDDIREREMESLREQRVATARLDRIRESSPEETRRPRSSAAKSPSTTTVPAEAAPPEQGSPVRRLHKRTSSWQSLSKSQPELGKENSPIAVYRKSVETVGVAERDVVASAEKQPVRPFSNRRTDSQDLLRRLARVSNTPSPKGPVTAPAPAPAPAPVARDVDTAPQTALPDTPSAQPKERGTPATAAPAEHVAPKAAPAPQNQPGRERRHDTPHDGTTPELPSSAPKADDVDTTPMPVEHSLVNPKTPYVMGGWVDTPGPRPNHKPVVTARHRSQSPKRSNSSKADSQEKPAAASAESGQTSAGHLNERSQQAHPRPHLPSSALQAIVQEARATHDYGDDTIHSLEDLIAPFTDNEVEEDTLQGLELPTNPPRSEAERARQAELVGLHRLREHLRATQTGIRDTSRSMRRASSSAEQMEIKRLGEKTSVVVRERSSEFSPWIWFRSFFWDERLSLERRAAGAPLRMWGGVTLFGILLTLSFIWWASETVACEIFCHPEYASYSPYPFAVNMDAPQPGVVIPTLIYRTLFKSWSTPIVSPVAALLSWIGTTLWAFVSGVRTTSLRVLSYGSVPNGGPVMAAHTQTVWDAKEDVLEEESWDWSMAEDEVLRR